MLSRTWSVLLGVPIGAMLAANPISVLLHLGPTARLVLSMVVAGVVAGTLTRRAHSSGRAWATGIAAAALVLALTLAVVFAVVARGPPGAYS
jgi:hypothetical protein